jgi:hypothetical protein
MGVSASGFMYNYQKAYQEGEGLVGVLDGRTAVESPTEGIELRWSKNMFHRNEGSVHNVWDQTV